MITVNLKLDMESTTFPAMKLRLEKGLPKLNLCVISKYFNSNFYAGLQYNNTSLNISMYFT